MADNSVLPSPTMWMVRASEKGVFVDDFLKREEACIGWGYIGLILPTDSDDARYEASRS